MFHLLCYEVCNLLVEFSLRFMDRNVWFGGSGVGGGGGGGGRVAPGAGQAPLQGSQGSSDSSLLQQGGLSQNSSMIVLFKSSTPTFGGHVSKRGLTPFEANVGRKL